MTYAGGVSVLINYVFPIIGSLLGFVLSVTPVKKVHKADRRRDLGHLNPIPSCVFLATCLCWLLFGAAISDPFIFCANIPCLPVSLYIILHCYALAGKKLRLHMERIILGSSVLILLLGSLYVFDTRKKVAVQINGTVAMCAQILLYASPLARLKHVIQTKNSASLLLYWILAGLGCSSTWFFYGVAIHKIPVIVPHFLGMVLNVFQLILRMIFPRSPTLEEHDSTSVVSNGDTSSAGSEEEEEDIELGDGYPTKKKKRKKMCGDDRPSQKHHHHHQKNIEIPAAARHGQHHHNKPALPPRRVDSRMALKDADALMENAEEYQDNNNNFDDQDRGLALSDSSSSCSSSPTDDDNEERRRDFQ